MPSPNTALQEMIDRVHLDMVFVQFYNNPPCDVRTEFNFERWNNWARDKNTVFLVGLPAREQAAPSGGYVPLEHLSDRMVKAKSMDRMRGAVLWDASQAWSNDGYHHKVKESLTGSLKGGHENAHKDQDKPSLQQSGCLKVS